MENPSIIGNLLILYVMCCGAALIWHRSPKGITIFNKWLLKIFRTILGGMLLWIGKKIKGA